MINVNYLRNLQDQHEALEKKIKQHTILSVDTTTLQVLKKEKLLLKEKIASLLKEEA